MPPKLLILVTRADEAQGILAGLRQVGLEAKGVHCPRLDELLAMVTTATPDLLLCAPQPPLIDLASTLESHRKLALDLPLILLTDAAMDQAQILQARRAGARDACEKGNLPWLALVISREFSDLQQRRLVGELQRRVQSLQEICDKIAGGVPGGKEDARPPRTPDRDDERQFAQRINRALGGDYFQLFYQPIIGLKGDGQERYNVFIRLRDDRQGVREAKEFLAAAVQSGRMTAIDRWVIEHAILVLADQRHQGRKLNFFINLAEETLREEALVPWLGELLTRRQLEGDWLTFQLLEEQVLANVPRYGQFSQELAALGCHTAFNRYGGSPRSEKLLASLPVDFVKLDAQLTTGIADDERKEQQLGQLIDKIRAQGKASIATNIEDAGTLSILWTAGVDYVQGNFLQRPSPHLEPIQ